MSNEAMLQTFTFHVSVENKPWEHDFRIVCVIANTQSEALGLVLEAYPEVQAVDVESIEMYADLKPLVVEEIMQDYCSQ